MVEQMEKMFDASDSAPSGEELAAEIERYLRERSGDD
jgi:hypothetical protein